MSKNPGQSAQTTTPEPAYASLSFVKRTNRPRSKYYDTDWFAVPDEEYGAGNITGLRAALEFHQWIKDQPDESLHVVRNVIKAVMRVFVADFDLYAHDRRGAAVMFFESVSMAMIYTATHADFAKSINTAIQNQLAYKAAADERDAIEKGRVRCADEDSKSCKAQGDSMTTNPGSKPTAPAFCTPGKAHPSRVALPLPIERQLAIESALQLSAWHLRKNEIHQAAGHAIRASRALKQACETARDGRTV